MLFSRAFSFSLVLSVVLASGSLYTDACNSLLTVLSSASSVYYPGFLNLNPNYDSAIYHWASSSTQEAACVVEPGNTADVAAILSVIASTKTPFAVKSGGHATNPGFSSTTGIHISMSRFSQVVYDGTSQTAVVGSGLNWDEVYTALEPYGVNIIGGRVTGVGVGGFTLGGGYSWKTNQYGLAVDNVVAIELVQPNGTISNVTAKTNPDLFFGLRGGGNNFGIVTRFTLRTFTQTEVWGGSISHDATQFDRLNAAIAAFAANVTDPKAQILPTYNAVAGLPVASNILFYDGPSPPSGIFDEFLSIPYLTSDISTRSFFSLVLSSPSNATNGSRAFFHTVPIKQWTPTILQALVNETTFWGPRLLLASATFVSYDIEPFLSTYLTHSTSSSAFPPDSARSPSVATFPLNIFYSWISADFDQIIHDAIWASADHLRAVAIQEQGAALGSAPLYNNYAMYDTPLNSLYSENVPKLQALAQMYDPQGVMKLAGGFKL